MMVVVPKIVELFEAMQVELEPATLALIAVSDFVGAYWPVFLSILVALPIAWIVARRNQRFRLESDRVLWRIPFIGRIVRGATLVIVASSCWGPELCDAYAEVLEASLDSDATVVDFSAHLDRPPFTKVGEVRVDASWGSAPLRVYRRW